MGRFFLNIATMEYIRQANDVNTLERAHYAIDSLLRNYLSVNHAMTYTKRLHSSRPSFTIESFKQTVVQRVTPTHIEGELVNKTTKHCFAEVTSDRRVISSEEALDTLYNNAGDVTLGFFENNFSIFAIVLRGVYIGFYLYKTNPELFDLNIPLYKGFVPLSYRFSQYEWSRIVTKTPGDITGYDEYINRKINIENRPEVLNMLGVRTSPSIRYPHVYDLTNAQHHENIHQSLKYIFESEIQ